MHSTTFFRAVMTVLVLLCCALVAVQQGRHRSRPHMVTELVSVMYVPARPVPSPSAAEAPNTQRAVAPEAAPAPAPAPATRVVRNSGKATVASARAPARVVVAAAQPKAHRAASKKREINRSGDAIVASAPPVPSFLLPVRRLGYSLQRKLVHAGVLKLCAGTSPNAGADCVRPAPDS